MNILCRTFRQFYRIYDDIFFRYPVSFIFTLNKNTGFRKMKKNDLQCFICVNRVCIFIRTLCSGFTAFMYLEFLKETTN